MDKADNETIIFAPMLRPTLLNLGLHFGIPILSLTQLSATQLSNQLKSK